MFVFVLFIVFLGMKLLILCSSVYLVKMEAIILNIWIKKEKVDKRKVAIQKELNNIEKQEEKWKKVAEKTDISNWKEKWEKKLPQTVYDTLEKSFCKAFEIVFEKGTGIIEKSYNREEIEQDYQIQDYAVKLKGSKKELRTVKKSTKKANLKNQAVTTATGLGLGILGIGMPDIVMFVGILLKGIYETALRYGIDYNVPEERFFILKMMETALAKGEKWEKLDSEIEEMIQNGIAVLPEDCAVIKKQIEQTASAFAMDMLVLKFVQGFPIVGVIGGVGNSIYYKKIMQYVDIKYQKRYLLQLL